MNLLINRKLFWILLILLLVGEFNAVWAQAEAGPPPQTLALTNDPPMRNIFRNVLWGSLAGGMVFMGWTTLDDERERDERYSFKVLVNQFVVGATYGGILGLVGGVYLSMNNITFDEGKSRIAFFQPEAPKFQPKNTLLDFSRATNFKLVEFKTIF